MKLGNDGTELDEVDWRILGLLQQNCKQPLAKIGAKVGLSAPSVIDRIKRMEDHGIIRGYTAIVDARKLGKDVTGFIGVFIGHPRFVPAFEEAVAQLDDVLECHHVTGEYSLLLKVKTTNTSSLEELIGHVRSLEGVERTETMIAFSTSTERLQAPIEYNGTNGVMAHKRQHRRGEDARKSLNGG
jgi:Lrp/AsnC family transcriptional regulator, leucine-responsive regulatory protein